MEYTVNLKRYEELTSPTLVTKRSVSPTVLIGAVFVILLVPFALIIPAFYDYTYSATPLIMGCTAVWIVLCLGSVYLVYSLFIGRTVEEPPIVERRLNETLSLQDEYLTYTYTVGGITYEYTIMLKDVLHMRIWPAKKMVYFDGAYTCSKYQGSEFIDTNEYTVGDYVQFSIPYYFDDMDDMFDRITKATGIELEVYK